MSREHNLKSIQPDPAQLRDRLQQPHTSRAEALRQFQATTPLHANALNELQPSSAASGNGGSRKTRKWKGEFPPEDTRGGEHIVYFDEASQRVIKATWYNPDAGFGYGCALGSHSRGATPSEYLDRLDTNNRIFNDDVSVECIVPVTTTADGPRYSIVTSQPFIKGRDATTHEIGFYMTGKGFEQLGAGAYHHAGEALLVYDLFPKNVKLAGPGMIHPIDPVIQRVKPDFVDFLKQSRYFGRGEGSKGGAGPVPERRASRGGR